MISKHKIAVIIVNWNGAKMLPMCLESLAKQSLEDFKIYLVDNGSTDESVRLLKNNYPNVEIIQLEKNYGFAEPNNIGIRKAMQDNEGNLKYICLLNNDIEVAPQYLEGLVRSAEMYEKDGLKLGVLAAKLLFYYEKGVINTVGTVTYPDGSGMERGFKEPDTGQYESPVEIFGSCAGAVLYTNSMLKDISYKNKNRQDCFFDSDFFAYYEDLDLNYRSRLLGYRAFYVPKAVGFHMHSATGKEYSSFKSFYVHRNHYFVLLKNFPLPHLLRGFIIMFWRYLMLIWSMVILRKGPAAELGKKTGKLEAVKIVFRSWGSIIKLLPNMLSKRHSIQRKRKVSCKEFGKWFKNDTYLADIKKMIYE